MCRGTVPTKEVRGKIQGEPIFVNGGEKGTEGLTCCQYGDGAQWCADGAEISTARRG